MKDGMETNPVGGESFRKDSFIIILLSFFCLVYGIKLVDLSSFYSSEANN